MSSSFIDPSYVVPYFDMAFIDLLSVSAILTTFGLFLCGIPICQNIARRGSTEGISGAPFYLGTIGCFFWLRYGVLKGDNSVITINGSGAVLQIIYLAFYYRYSRPKGPVMQVVLLLGVLTMSMLAYIHLYSVVPDVALNHLGIMCMILNIMNFGAPLAGLRDVLRTKSTENLPLPLCVANLLVSAQWFLYGRLVGDPYIMSPNCVGIALAIFQLSLFLIYPRKRIHIT